MKGCFFFSASRDVLESLNIMSRICLCYCCFILLKERLSITWFCSFARFPQVRKLITFDIFPLRIPPTGAPSVFCGSKPSASAASSRNCRGTAFSPMASKRSLWRFPGTEPWGWSYRGGVPGGLGLSFFFGFLMCGFEVVRFGMVFDL